MPELDVFGFRDLVIGKASADLGELRKVLEGLVESPDALAVGEDFVRLSSAKFEPNRIEVTERIGLDLILPLGLHASLRATHQVGRAEASPCEGGSRSCWAAPGSGAGIGRQLIGKAKFAAPKGRLLALVGREGVNAAMSVASKLGGDQLKKMNSEARRRRTTWQLC